MLVGSDEHDRELVRRNRVHEVVARVEVRGEAEVEHVDELVDPRRRTGAAEDERVVGTGTDGVLDDRARVLAESGRLPARARRHGVRVGVERQHLLADEVLDERERATRRRVVGVRHAARAVGPFDRLVVADDRVPDGLDQALGVWFHGCTPKGRVYRAPRNYSRRNARVLAIA